MDISDAAALLKDMYKEGGRRRERAVFVPLFGIKYAKELRSLADERSSSITQLLRELVDHASLPRSYVIEIMQGINLSRYVAVNDSAELS